ncbi:recombinase family protein [Brucella tritici]|nr:hypothetical protein [Brucella tritici]
MSAVIEMQSRPSNVPAFMAGAQVGAIIPRSIEEMWRVSTMVVRAGLAPQALVGKKEGEEAVSAVAIAVMAGAELGLPPMVALRSFTVIGGRPALYGDGIINVARRSRKAAYIRTGYDEARKCGWCEAKRADNGEEKRVEFSEADARSAGLWDDRKMVRRKVYGEFKEVPNDAPWFRYPKRMLAWRAAGYCLRELFADVLGGITDEFEANEIAGSDEPVNVTPPSPPSPAITASKEEVIEEAEIVNDGEAFDLEAFLSKVDEAMATGKTEEQIVEIWDDFDVEATLTEDEEALQRAFDLRKHQIARVLRAMLNSHPVNAG